MAIDGSATRILYRSALPLKVERCLMPPGILYSTIDEPRASHTLPSTCTLTTITTVLGRIWLKMS